MTNLSPEANRVLYADATGLSLTEQLTAAYERNVAGGLAEEVVPDSLAAVAAAAVAQARAVTPETTTSIANLDPSFQLVAEAALRSTATLLERVGLETPSLAEFAEAGFDASFPRLAHAYETMQELDLEPQLVFAPVLAPEEWAGLYQDLQEDSGVNHDDRIKNGGLYIDSTVSSHWGELHESIHTMNVNGTDWQVLVLPGTNRPPQVSIDHNGKDSNGKLDDALVTQATDTGIPARELTKDNLHPTIDAYLTLQATRLQNNEPPLDDNTYTWLSGEFAGSDGRQAPYGRWNPVYGQVGVRGVGVGRRSGVLGVRLPVWG